jgi:hypothetical protein
MATASARLLGAEAPDNFNAIFGLREGRDMDLEAAIGFAQQVRWRGRRRSRTARARALHAASHYQPTSLAGRCAD